MPLAPMSSAALFLFWGLSGFLSAGKSLILSLLVSLDTARISTMFASASLLSLKPNGVLPIIETSAMPWLAVVRFVPRLLMTEYLGHVKLLFFWLHRNFTAG